jgi:hypothetical protein
MTIVREIEEEKKDEEVMVPVPVPVPVPVVMATKVEMQVQDHNVQGNNQRNRTEWGAANAVATTVETEVQDQIVQGNNQRDRAEWGTAKFVGPWTWTLCTICSIGGVLLAFVPIGLLAFFCPCDTKKNIYRVDGKYYDEDDHYLGDENKVAGFRRRSFRPTHRGRH